MKTSKETVSIILDKGVEDAMLLKEISRIIAKGNLGNGKEIFKNFPMIMELRQRLIFLKDEDFGSE